MDKAQLRRHDLIFVTAQGKKKIWQQLDTRYEGEVKKLVQEIFLGACDIPAFVRRAETKENEIAIGFVPAQRVNGNRVRVPAFCNCEDIGARLTPYDALTRNAFTHEPETECVKAILELYELAVGYELKVGVLGSAALEFVTGLPYTDAASDIDLLIKPAQYECLRAFYNEAKSKFSDINMDFELDLPNGYGVKLAEIFMDTKTVLGKGLEDVTLLKRSEIMQYLK